MLWAHSSSPKSHLVSFRAANINVVPGTSGGSADATSKTSMLALVAFGATNGIVAWATNGIVVPGVGACSADARSKTSMPALVAFRATNCIVASGATNGIVVPGTGACSADATSKTARSRPFSPARADVLLPLFSDLLPSAPWFL